MSTTPKAGRQAGRPVEWTKPAIIAALKRYGALIGEPPAAIRMSQDKRHLDWLPSRQTVENRFGSWNAAIKAAGFEPRKGRKV